MLKVLSKIGHGNVTTSEALATPIHPDSNSFLLKERERIGHEYSKCFLRDFPPRVFWMVFFDFLKPRSTRPERNYLSPIHRKDEVTISVVEGENLCVRNGLFVEF